MNYAKNKTLHCELRMRQRAIPDSMLAILAAYGEEEYQKGRTAKLFLPKRSVKKLRNDLKSVLAHLDSLKDVYVVEGEEGKFITAAHNYS